MSSHCEPLVGVDDELDIWHRCCPFTDEFPNWKFVPEHLKSRKGWESVFRKVKKGTVRRGFVIEPAAHGGTVRLYHQTDTVPYEPTLRTLAVRAFDVWFADKASKTKYIRWSEEKCGWLDCYGRLGYDDISHHVKGRKILGVFGGDRTHFRGIDLDLKRDGPEKFLQRFRVLQAEFHGRDGWHYQIADEDAGGVHLIQVFPESAYLDACIRELRATLKELDRKYPGLGLANLEVYPAKNHAFRLPLCRGRSMLTDRPTKDVVEYVTWLLHPDSYMEAGDVYEYLRVRLKKAAPASCMSGSRPAIQGTLSCRGRFRQLLTEFWGGKPVMDLNKALYLTALVLEHEVDEREAVAILESYCDELPDKSFSHRLTHNRPKVSKHIEWVVQKVYGGKSLGDESATKLAAVADAFRRQGFRVSDKATWDRAGVAAFRFEWSEAEKEEMRAKLVPVLKCDEDTAFEAVRRFVTFVKRHDGNQIAMKAIPAILDGLDIHWCQDKKGRSKKLTAFVKSLRDMHWLYVAVGHLYHGDGRKGRARQYGIGYRLEQKFSVAGRGQGDEELLLLPRQAQPPHGGLLFSLVGKTHDSYLEDSAFDEYDDCWQDHEREELKRLPVEIEEGMNLVFDARSRMMREPDYEFHLLLPAGHDQQGDVWENDEAAGRWPPPPLVDRRLQGGMWACFQRDNPRSSLFI